MQPITLHQLSEESEALLESVGGRARALFRSGRFVALDNGTAVMSLPNAATLERAQEVESELANAIGQRYPGTRLRLRSDDDPNDVAAGVPNDVAASIPAGVPAAETPTSLPPAGTAPGAPAAVTEFSEEHEIDLHDLVDAPADSGNTALDQITAAFPGAEIVE